MFYMVSCLCLHSFTYFYLCLKHSFEARPLGILIPGLQKLSSQRTKFQSVTTTYYQHPPPVWPVLWPIGHPGPAFGKICVLFGYRFGYRSARAPSLRVSCARDWTNSLSRSTKARPRSWGWPLQHTCAACDYSFRNLSYLAAKFKQPT